MEKLPKEVKADIRKFINASKKAQEYRDRIERYFKSIGINTDFDCSLDGGAIIDCLIDASTDYNFKESVELIEGILNDREDCQ